VLFIGNSDTCWDYPDCCCSFVLFLHQGSHYPQPWLTFFHCSVTPGIATQVVFCIAAHVVLSTTQTTWPLQLCICTFFAVEKHHNAALHLTPCFCLSMPWQTTCAPWCCTLLVSICRQCCPGLKKIGCNICPHDILHIFCHWKLLLMLSISKCAVRLHCAIGGYAPKHGCIATSCCKSGPPIWCCTKQYDRLYSAHFWHLWTRCCQFLWPKFFLLFPFNTMPNSKWLAILVAELCWLIQFFGIVGQHPTLHLVAPVATAQIGCCTFCFDAAPSSPMMQHTTHYFDYLATVDNATTLHLAAPFIRIFLCQTKQHVPHNPTLCHWTMPNTATGSIAVSIGKVNSCDFYLFTTCTLLHSILHAYILFFVNIGLCHKTLHLGAMPPVATTPLMSYKQHSMAAFQTFWKFICHQFLQPKLIPFQSCTKNCGTLTLNPAMQHVTLIFWQCWIMSQHCI